MMKVLKSKSQIRNARRLMRARGISCADSGWKLHLRNVLHSNTFVLGDELKSWDVLSTSEFVSRTVGQQAAVLDIGCYGSEILPVLHRLGYSNLTGVDLNRNLRRMPYPDEIRYEVADFMCTPFEAEEYSVITAISVIEHGFRPAPLLTEISRLLKPGGYFIASFDYWPEKISTEGVKFFDMDWQIFSKAEVLELVSQADSRGLKPVGDLDLDAAERPIDCAGKSYTFGWLVLRKMDQE